MIKIEKTFGIRGAANDETILRLQEVIADAIKQYGWVGKAVIDAEKIMVYKFGLKLGFARHSINGLVVDENGIIRYVGFSGLEIMDRQILTDLYVLFGKPCPY